MDIEYAVIVEPLEVDEITLQGDTTEFETTNVEDITVLTFEA